MCVLFLVVITNIWIRGSGHGMQILSMSILIYYFISPVWIETLEETAHGYSQSSFPKSSVTRICSHATIIRLFHPNCLYIICSRLLRRFRHDCSCFELFWIVSWSELWNCVVCCRLDESALYFQATIKSFIVAIRKHEFYKRSTKSW
jgi:hypothetical protein